MKISSLSGATIPKGEWRSRSEGNQDILDLIETRPSTAFVAANTPHSAHTVPKAALAPCASTVCPFGRTEA
jgi:hypothetical protein